MQTTNEVIGYRVVRSNNECYSDEYVHFSESRGNFTSVAEPTPIARGDAFRRLASYLDLNPGEDMNDFVVVPVQRVLTPMETATKELSGLLSSLCSRHGLSLGLSQDQIERKIASELSELGASPVVDRINGILAGR